MQAAARLHVTCRAQTSRAELHWRKGFDALLCAARVRTPTLSVTGCVQACQPQLKACPGKCSPAREASSTAAPKSLQRRSESVVMPVVSQRGCTDDAVPDPAAEVLKLPLEKYSAALALAAKEATHFFDVDSAALSLLLSVSEVKEVRSHSLLGHLRSTYPLSSDPRVRFGKHVQRSCSCRSRGCMVRPQSSPRPLGKSCCIHCEPSPSFTRGSRTLRCDSRLGISCQ